MANRKPKVIKKVLGESKVGTAFEVIRGFNYPDGKGGEVRVDVGKKKPTIVFENDFASEVWKELVKLEAVSQMVEESPLAEGESIAAEVLDGDS